MGGTDRADEPRANGAAPAVEAALDSLSRVLLAETSLEDTLHQVAVAAVTSLGQFDEAAVTLVDERGHRTAACTNAETLRIDEAQYAADEGPCLEAIRTGEIVEVDVVEAAERWPDFTRAAAALGVVHFCGAPLQVHDQVIGALNLYGKKSVPLGTYDAATLLRLCEQASVILANAEVYTRTRTLVDQLGEALTSRAVIDQAKGILMAVHRVDADAAFDLLRQQSQRTNRKLHDVAVELVESASRPDGGQTGP